MVQASKNLFNAAQSGDLELAEATMVNLRSSLETYLTIIREGDKDGKPY
jgi:hypothetical protein